LLGALDLRAAAVAQACLAWNRPPRLRLLRDLPQPADRLPLHVRLRLPRLRSAHGGPLARRLLLLRSVRGQGDRRPLAAADRLGAARGGRYGAAACRMAVELGRAVGL